MEILRSIREILFSPKCLACGEDSPYHLCEKCLKNIDFLCVDSYAPVRKYFSNLWTLAAYEGPWMEVIHKFKYGRERTACRVIRDFLKKHVDQFYYVDCLVPVPLYPTRYFRRGYNQSAIIANMVSKILKRPVFNRAVIKSFNTEQQVGKSLNERLENLKGAFSRPKILPQSVKGKNILLVDDVVTSGTTINECAKVLIKSGAKRVDVLTLAKTL